MTPEEEADLLELVAKLSARVARSERNAIQAVSHRLHQLRAQVGVDHDRRLRALEARYVRHGIDWDDVEFCKPSEVCDKFALSREHVYRMLKQGKLPFIRFGGERTIRIPKFWLVDRIAVPVEQYRTLRARSFTLDDFHGNAQELS